LYNKYLVIITAEKKEKYISRTIKSCLNQYLCKRLKIVVVYSRLYNEKEIKKKFKKFNNIIFLKTKKKNSHTKDQLFKVKEALKYCKDQFILLMDGDDIFKPRKIYYLDKLKLKKDKIYLNNHSTIINNKIIKTKKKNYKKLFLYKTFFNDWPEKINTSSITIHSKLLKSFYKSYNPFKWKYLAIDVQLILYFFYKNKKIFISKVLTLKRENINNFDKNYSNFFTKIYWNRRHEQHLMTKEISNKFNLIDRLLTFIFKNLLN